MTIGANDILNTSTDVSQKKSAKKTDYTSEDFSTLSNQFAHIFSNQFTHQFQNQIDYAPTAKNTNFMANTATSMTENKYYSPSTSNHSQTQTNSSTQTTQTAQTTSSQDVQRQEFKTQQPTEQQQTTSSVENTSAQQNQTQQAQSQTGQTQAEAQQSTKSAEETTQQNTAKAEAQTEEQKAEAGKEKDAKAKAETAAIASEELKKADAKTTATTTDNKEVLIGKAEVNTDEKAKAEKTNSLKVAIKDDQIQAATELVAKTSEAPTAVAEVSQVKDAKVEKLEVKKSKKESSDEAKKELKTEAKTDVNTDKKTEAKTEAKVEERASEDLKAKASLERLTANVVEGKPEETTALDKILNKEQPKTSAHSKEHSDAKSQVEFKNPSAFANQNFEQNFGQNQNNQNPLKDNILKGLLNLDTSLLKHNVNGNMQFNNVMQTTQQPASMMEKNIAEQVMNQIKGNISAEKSEVSMVLNPERLGKVTLNIMNEKGALSAEIRTESKEAADALTKNINDLKETLKQQGVICANLVVKVEEPNKADNQTNFANQEQTHRDFGQGEHAQNSNEGSFQNSSNNSKTVKTEYQQNTQEEQDQPAQTVAEDKGLVDYRV